MSEIKLCSGKYVDVLSMSESDIDINDIACSLSKICRYNGHCSEFYSVAAHSIFVSNYSMLFYVVNAVVNKFASSGIEDITIEDVDDIFSGGFYHNLVEDFIKEYELFLINLSLAGLLHDSAESYVGDMVKPVKDLPQFSFFRDIENNIIKTIYFKYGIRSFYDHKIVNFTDNFTLRVEMLSSTIYPNGKFSLFGRDLEKNYVEGLFLFGFNYLIDSRRDLGVFCSNLIRNDFVDNCILLSSFFIKKFFTQIKPGESFDLSCVDLSSENIVELIVDSGIVLRKIY